LDKPHSHVNEGTCDTKIIADTNEPIISIFKLWLITGHN